LLAATRRSVPVDRGPGGLLLTGRTPARHVRLAIVGLLLLALGQAAFAQTEESSELRPSLDETRESRRAAETTSALPEASRARVLELYDAAIGALEAAAGYREEAAAFERERLGVARTADALRAELDRPVPAPRSRLPEDADVERAEAELARERARLGAHRSALRDYERLAEERTATRNEFARRLGALDQRIEVLGDELRTAPQRESHPESTRAMRSSLLARRDATSAEVESLRAELVLLDARGTLIPWKIDRAQRHVEQSEGLVALLERATRDLHRRANLESLRSVREQCSAAVELDSGLAAIARETENLAELLWGERGVVARDEQTVISLGETRKYVSDLDRIVQLTRRKFEAYGYRGSLSRWWPEIPEDFPGPGDLAARIRVLEEQIPEAQHQLIRFEQDRARIRERGTQALDLVREGGVNDEVRAGTRRLFVTQRELLDQLIRLQGRYTSRLVELETVARHFLSEVERVQSFLYEHLLWARSVPRPIIPRPADIGQALGWFFSAEDWGRVLAGARRTVAAAPVASLALAALFVLLLVLRPALKRRITTLGQRAQSEGGSLRDTLEALLETVLLAAPLPLALFVAGRSLADTRASTFDDAAAQAFLYLASVAALLELARQLLAPRGLAEAHFCWPRRFTRPAHRGLLWPQAVLLPLLFVALHLATAGIRLVSPAELQVYNNSLGRIAFVIGMAVLGVALLGLFRPRKTVEPDEPDRGTLSSNRLSAYGYPFALLTTALPAVLAAAGFYITGLLLAYQMLRTLWLVLGLLIAAGLMYRWRVACRRRMARESGVENEPTSVAEFQVRKLFRFAVALVAAIGLYSIWYDAMPTLRLLERVQIWPHVAMIEEPDRGLALSDPSAIEPAASPSEQRGADTAAPPSLPGLPAVATDDAAGSAATVSDSDPLTLWKLLEALLAALITVVLVQNVPGLLEFLLQRRTLLDQGVRIAVGTLIRYTIIIIGVSVVFGLLGVSWSRIQWLAAALTFGLGFGLQEIVANFVSGLILLLERPVRVGDAVTIGNLQGRVNRIQIRATTITLWDRSEMIVPNKEFITTKLINWTLSDSRRRIDVPLRVAYGAEPERVKALLAAVAQAHPDVFDDPPPQILLIEFGDDSLHFELRVFVDFGEGLRVKDELHMAINRVFRENGVEFALPRLDIRMPRRGTEGSSSA